MAFPLVLAVLLAVVAFRSGATVGSMVNPRAVRNPLWRSIIYTDPKEIAIDIATIALGVGKFVRHVPAVRGFVTSILFRRALANLIGAELKTVAGFIPVDLAAFGVSTSDEGVQLALRTADLVNDALGLGSVLLVGRQAGPIGLAVTIPRAIRAARVLFADAVALGNAWLDFVQRKSTLAREIGQRYERAGRDFAVPLERMARETIRGIQGFIQWAQELWQFANPSFPLRPETPPPSPPPEEYPYVEPFRRDIDRIKQLSRMVQQGVFKSRIRPGPPSDAWVLAEKDLFRRLQEDELAQDYKKAFQLSSLRPAIPRARLASILQELKKRRDATVIAGIEF